ncbi:MAG: hydrolase, partial [Actinomycetota bacterium]
DIVPTLLAAAGIDEQSAAAELATTFTEVHPLPGTSQLGVVDGDAADQDRAVYILTRDNICEGDTGASAVARATGQGEHPPPELMIHVPADVGANFEGIVARSGIDSHLYKLVRTFDDPATWTEPGVRHLASVLDDGTETYRHTPLADQWELYDLDVDPIEATNLADEGGPVFDELASRLSFTRRSSVPARNVPWPYATRGASAS